MLSDGTGTHTYQYDAEGRMTSGAGVTYTYDGEGERVKDSGGTLYWRGAGGQVLEETDTSGNWINDYIFFDGLRLGRISTSTPYLYFGDLLGSEHTITDTAGHVCYDADFYPFGGELAFTNTCSQSYKFAGMHRDSATGLDHTEYRQYSSNLGRWMSPDPSGMAAVSLTNPQSWNMYAYVTNNPTNLIDALGLSGGGYGDGGATASGGEDFMHLPSCVDPAAEAAAIAAAAGAVLGTDLADQVHPNGVGSGGENEFSIPPQTVSASTVAQATSAKLDPFHHDQYQILTTEPNAIVPSSGNVIHLLFDERQLPGGMVELTNISAHIDIHSFLNAAQKFNLWGALGHGGVDVLFFTLLEQSRILAGLKPCGYKFD